MHSIKPDIISGRKPMSRIKSFIDTIVNWIATNARSFSYLLPDTMELALYLALVAYFTMQLGQIQGIS